MAVGLVLLLTTFLGAATVTAVGYLAAAGRLPRNGWAGIRVPYSMSSDERWYATHRAGGPMMLYGGVAALAIGLAFVPFALAGVIPDALGIAVILGQAVILVAAAIGSAVVGVRRAKRLVG